MIFRKRSPGWSHWEWLKHLAISWNWKMVRENQVQIGPFVLEATPYYMELLWREWRSWKNWYLPPWSLSGKTVLDVGAGCGETALFYYHHGASRVIAVEPDASLESFLRKNKALNSWDMEIVTRPFDLSMLKWDFDFMKMDGEGCETKLLSLDSIPPCAIEVHENATAQSLEARFKMRTLPQKTNWVLQNFNIEPSDLTSEHERFDSQSAHYS